MATKKISLKKSAPEKTMIIKVAEKIGEIAGKIVNQKDHLMEMAGDALGVTKSQPVKSPLKAATKKNATVVPAKKKPGGSTSLPAKHGKTGKTAKKSVSIPKVVKAARGKAGKAVNKPAVPVKKGVGKIK